MIYLSIVIPVLNEERYIRSTLSALADQNYPRERFELLVVDGRSSDNTRSVVRTFIHQHPEINIRLLENPGRLSSCARNIGIREAKGQLIGIIDAHVYLPSAQLFATMEQVSEENNALCLARPAPLDVPGLTKGIPYWIALARKSWLGHSRASHIYGDFEGFVDPVSSGFAYDRSVFDRVGYFDESFDAAEDVEFHFRLKQMGIEAYTSPRLLIYSYPRKSFRALFHQQIRYGEGRARFVRKHPGGFTKETPIPALLFIFFAFAPFVFWCSRQFPPIRIGYGAVMALYWLIVLSSGFSEALKRKRFVAGILISFGIWLTHMGLGWGFLKRIWFPVERSNMAPRRKRE